MRSESSLPDSLQMAALKGLSSKSKTLPAALFYDAIGARIFEEICKVPEYYPTRTEISILAQNAPTLASEVGSGAAIIEYESRSGEKVQYLLDHLDSPAAYIPVDVSHEQLMEVAAERSLQYPKLPILPICADYTEPFDFPLFPNESRRIAFFPGSTIGNLHPNEAIAFLKQVRQTVKKEGKLILGVDRRKDPSILNAAYNDKAGHTAAFNLNILAHLNRDLKATFNLSHFRHIAFFNSHASRIEMHLESLISHQIMIAGRSIDFEEGERIHTECSYKYDEENLTELAKASGFQIDVLFTDNREWFWIALLSSSY